MRFKLAAIHALVTTTLAGALVAGTAYHVGSTGKMRQELERHERNAEVRARALDTVRDAYGRAIADTERLELTVQELLRDRRKLAEDVEALGVQLRRAQAVGKTVAKTEAKIWGWVEAPAVQADSVADGPRGATLLFEDKHLRVEATIDSAGMFAGSVESVDTLVQVVERVPKRFLCFTYGTKGIRQVIRSSNPHTRIVYSEYIELR